MTFISNEEREKRFNVIRAWSDKKLGMIRFVTDTLEHHLTCKMPEFHCEIYEMLLSERKMLVAAPRGFAKSYICSVFYPLYSVLMLEKKKVLIISASEDKAIEFLRTIKFEIENNKLLKLIFGNQVGKGKWTESNIILKNGAEIKARGAEGQIRGYRPDLIVLDDIETEESVATPDRRRKLETWIFKACFNSLTPNGQFIWIGTILTHLCLINEYFEKDNGWKKKKYKAYRFGVEKAGEELWPELWSHNRLQEQKHDIGSYFFSTEYMNDPTANERAPIKQEMIRTWKTVDELPENLSCVITLDPAYSEDEKADAKVACLIGIDAQNRRWLLDVVHTRETINTYMHQVLNLWGKNKNRITSLGIPNKGVEKGFFNSFINECERLNVHPPVAELTNVFTSGSGAMLRNKTRRVIAALQPLFEQGRYIIGSHHGIARDELLSIGSSRHDDIVDCMAYAEQLLQPDLEDMVVEEVDRYGQPVDRDTGDEDWGDFGYGY